MCAHRFEVVAVAEAHEPDPGLALVRGEPPGGGVPPQQAAGELAVVVLETGEALHHELLQLRAGRLNHRVHPAAAQDAPAITHSTRIHLKCSVSSLNPGCACLLSGTHLVFAEDWHVRR